MNSARIDQIDGLRGFAALFIAFTHFIASNHDYELVMSSSMNVSWLIVEIFFVLTGFLLMHRSKIRWEIEEKPKLSFFFRRWFRVWPLWIFGVLVYWLVKGFSAEKFLEYITFYFGFVPNSQIHADIPMAWTLFVEEVFYVFFLFAFVLLTRKSFVLLFWFLSLAGYAAYFFIALDGVPTNQTLVAEETLRCFHWFFFGIFLSLLNSRFGMEPLENIKQRIPLIDFVYPILVGLAIYLVSINTHNVFSKYVLILAIFAWALSKDSIANRILGHRYSVLIGKSCFSIYFLHVALFEILGPLRVTLYGMFEPTFPKLYIDMVSFIPVLGILIPLTIFTKHIIEDVGVRWGEKFIQRFIHRKALP